MDGRPVDRHQRCADGGAHKSGCGGIGGSHGSRVSEFQTQSASPAVSIARDGGGEKENAPPQGAAVTAQPARRVHRKRPADLPNLPLAWEDTGSGLRPQSIVVDPGRRKGESPLIRFRLTPKREIYGKEMCQRLNLYKINKPGTAAPTSPAAGIYPPPPCPPPHPPPPHTHSWHTPTGPSDHHTPTQVQTMT